MTVLHRDPVKTKWVRMLRANSPLVFHLKMGTVSTFKGLVKRDKGCRAVIPGVQCATGTVPPVVAHPHSALTRAHA